MNDRIREILSYYRSGNLGVLTNLARILNHRRLGGTGKLVILPVETLGARAGTQFCSHPPAYEPRYFPPAGV